MTATFITADVFDGLAKLPDDSVDLVLSSPPFLALRSYLPKDHPDKAKEIGSEATPADFLDTLLDVVEACDRVLAPHGSLVFELGDTLAGSGGGGGDYLPGGRREGQPGFGGTAERQREGNAEHRRTKNRQRSAWPLDKSLCLIPTLFAASLAYGRNLLRPERTTEPWRIRNLIVWARPNPPVGALGDKFRPATSYLTVATKSRTRWFDLDAVRTAPLHPDKGVSKTGTRDLTSDPLNCYRGNSEFEAHPAGAPPLDYWVIPTEPYKGSHYATWPSDLCTIPIEAMCPRRVCRVCGEPSRRVVEASEKYAATAGFGKGINTRQPGQGMAASRRQQMGDMTASEYVTTGWTDCEHNRWRNGVVLDPFAGSGTTLAVAVGHGRDAIGIDLDSRNADLARERVGMFLEVL